MNLNNPRELTHMLLDLTCDISAQQQLKSVADHIFEDIVDNKGELNGYNALYKVVDLICDLSFQKEYKDVIDVLYENIASFTRDDINELISLALSLLRDISAYEGSRDLVYHFTDMICDVSLHKDAGEMAGVLLEKAVDLPDYEVLVENLKLTMEVARDLMRDLPTYEGAVEIVYELSNWLREMPFYDLLAHFVQSMPLEKMGLPALSGGVMPDFSMVESAAGDGCPKTPGGMAASF